MWRKLRSNINENKTNRDTRRTSPSTPRDEEFEAQLRMYRLDAKSEIKLLLLGTSESGKSTIFMKMKHFHQNWNDKERELYKRIIYSYVIQTMRTILETMLTLDIPLNPVNNTHRAMIMSLPTQIQDDNLLKGIIDGIRGLWSDDNLQGVVRRYKELQFNNSATYYFEALERISVPGYLPSNEDIVRCPSKTSGIDEASFKIGELAYRIFDVGGQLCRKWFHYFEDMDALVFVVSLSEYDQPLLENEGVHRMGEALTLFDSICNCRWFVRTPIVLLLDGADLFADKLTTSPLGKYFPEYVGGDSYDAARDYILWRFVSLNQNPENRSVYAHFTYTTDPQQIKFLLCAIQDIHLRDHLQKCGLE